MAKFSISFSVNEDVYTRCKQMFPSGRNQDVLIELLDAYEKQAHEVTHSALVNALSEMYKCSENELENVCKSFINEKNELENRISELENERIQLENNGIRLENERISSENEDIWMKMKRVITPFSGYLLENTAKKLSSKYGKEVTPLQILIDMFMRYTIERWSQWFYPFVLSDKEILEIAQQINPEIKNIGEIKKTLPK